MEVVLKKRFFCCLVILLTCKVQCYKVCALKENKIFEIQIRVLLLRGVIVTTNKLDRLAFFM